MEADCDQIIRKYAPDGSLTDGIREMEKQIRDLRDMVRTPISTYEIGGSTTADTVSKWFPDPPVIEDGMPKEYWKRLATELEKIIKDYAGQR